LLRGGGATLVVVGPLVGGILNAVRALDEPKRPNLWLVSELPLGALPEAFLADIARSQSLITVEEHVAHGGAGEILASALLRAGCAPRHFTSQSALGYVSGLYGSQKFHRAECGLDPASVLQLVVAAAP
jgi:transketolase